MLFTKDFNKAIYGLLISTFALFGLSILLSFNGISGYSISSGVSGSVPIWYNIFLLFPTIAFYFAIGYVTKEHRGALAAFLVKFLVEGYFLFQLYTKGASLELYDSFFWPRNIALFLTYLVFGGIHFKNIRGIYLISVFFALKGLFLGFNHYYYSSFVDHKLYTIGMENFLSIKVPSGESSYKYYPLLMNFLSYIHLPISLIVFWFVFNKIKQPGQIDISLRTIGISPKINKLTFSIIYWLLRIVLSGITLSLIVNTNHIFTQSIMGTTFNLLCLCFAIYVTGSLYRNFLSFYFVKNGWYPSWLYLGLNMPILNFFAWIATLIKPSKRDTAKLNSENSEYIASNNKTIPYEQVKETFIIKNRNYTIKAIIAFLMLLTFLYKLFIIDFKLYSFINDPLLSMIFAILTIFFTIGIILWYFAKEKALFILFGVQLLAIVLPIITNNESLPLFTSTTFLINIVIYYPLFHFDKLKFIRSGTHKEETEVEATI